MPEVFYFSPAGWFIYKSYFLLVVAIVVVTYYLFKKWRGSTKRRPSFVARFLVVSVIVFILALPLLEALLFSVKAESVCRTEGGLRIYRTVETEGFVGQMKMWAEHGFSYIEYNGPKRTKIRETIVNGEIRKETVNEFKSKYAVDGPKREQITDQFYVHSLIAYVRESKEFIGEVRTVLVEGSWFDLYANYLLRIHHSPSFCGDEGTDGYGTYEPSRKTKVLGYPDLIKATLRPKKT